MFKKCLLQEFIYKNVTTGILFRGKSFLKTKQKTKTKTKKTPPIDNFKIFQRAFWDHKFFKYSF